MTNCFAFRLICFFTFSISLSYSSSSLSSLSSDGFSLLAVKSAISSDPTRALSTWSETNTNLCKWTGITCDQDHRVTAMSLSGKGLAGYIPSEIGALQSLLSLDLSHNNFSGTVPHQITALRTLTHLDLSSNLLNGSLPEYLTNLTHLAGTLNLSFNRFSGMVPPSYGWFPVTLSLDLRHNNLTGKIPQEGSLLNQGPTAFSGNPNLCGFPLNTPCSEPEAQNPRIFSNPENPKNPNSQNGFAEKEKTKNGSVSVSVISGVSVVVGVVFISAFVIRKRWQSDKGKMGKEELEKKTSEEGQKGKFVILDEGFGLELENLLRASAYVVGKSKSGIVYKVVAGGRGSGVAGTVVAVRRLSEGNSTWRLKEFEAEVEAIERVQHPNIVRLRAYYYADDEKLLVSDFVGNGSLYTALHGGLANSLPPLSWAVRLKITKGIATGLTHIHECSPKKLLHGNIKSSKILLDDDLHPYISGFGITRLVSGTTKATNYPTLVSPTSSTSSSSLMYTAPEARGLGAKLTQKCDVYSFGIVLLEVLTGRLPHGDFENGEKTLESYVRKVFRDERPLLEIIDPVLRNEVHAKKQVVSLFHIALNCTDLDPEIRPRMRTVSDSLSRIGSR